MSLKLTQAAVDAFKLPSGKTDHVEFFLNTPGFGLRLRTGPAGARVTFIYQFKFNGISYRLTIGDARKMKLSDAHKAMQIMAGQIAKGINPATEQRREREAAQDAKAKAKVAKARKNYAETVTEYLEAKASDTKPRSLVEIKRALQRQFSTFDDIYPDVIDRAMVSERIDHLAKHNGRTAARNARIALSSFFAWCVEGGRCTSNPVIGARSIDKVQDRERVLADAELAAVLNKAPANDYGRIVRLLALTGQRRDEIGALRWSELHDIDDAERARIELPAARTKNSRPHTVPLSQAVLEVLAECKRRGDRDLVFGDGQGAYSGWSVSKASLDKACGVEEWRLHDLRRTAATRMADSGTQPHIIEAVLNHISGHKGGVAGIYNRAAYEPEKREALEALATYIKTALTKAKGGNVVRLRKA